MNLIVDLWCHLLRENLAVMHLSCQGSLARWTGELTCKFSICESMFLVLASVASLLAPGSGLSLEYPFLSCFSCYSLYVEFVFTAVCHENAARTEFLLGWWFDNLSFEVAGSSDLSITVSIWIWKVCKSFLPFVCNLLYYRVGSAKCPCTNFRYSSRKFELEYIKCHSQINALTLLYIFDGLLCSLVLNMGKVIILLLNHISGGRSVFYSNWGWCYARPPMLPIKIASTKWIGWKGKKNSEIYHLRITQFRIWKMTNIFVFNFNNLEFN